MDLPTYPPKIRKMVRWSPNPVRFAAMALALERVRIDNIPGALAEIGVHRGYCSKFLHEQLPERMLYLFATRLADFLAALTPVFGTPVSTS